jgi:hypothetical protein
MEEEINSLMKTARLAGLFLLLVAVTTGFSLGYVRTSLIVSGDAALTANNILANEFLFRMAIASNLFAQIFFLFFGLTIFRIFKEVNRTWAVVLLTSILASVAVGVVNSLNNLGALVVLSNADYLKAFSTEQINALMMIFLRLNNFGIGLAELISALYLFSFGLLIIKSRYIPQILGVLLLIGSFGFPINTFAKILVPQFYPATFTQLAMFGGALGGIPIILWLLIKGVKEQTQTSEV